MTILKKINVFYCLLFLVFIFFLQRQFFSLLDVELISSSNSIITFSYFALLIGISMMSVLMVLYYLPTIIVIKLVHKLYVSIPEISIQLSHVVSCFRTQRIKVVNRNKIYCTYRC